jgi:hypothetical protein
MFHSLQLEMERFYRRKRSKTKKQPEQKTDNDYQVTDTIDSVLAISYLLYAISFQQ